MFIFFSEAGPVLTLLKCFKKQQTYLRNACNLYAKINLVKFYFQVKSAPIFKKKRLEHSDIHGIVQMTWIFSSICTLENEPSRPDLWKIL